MSENNPTASDVTKNPNANSDSEVVADRWDRRFRIEGDAVEALKVVVADRSAKNS